MIIKQLSVFLENKTGRLVAAADVLAKNGVNIRALSLADTTDFGILRLIVDHPEKGRDVLTESGVIVRVTDVLAIAMDDVPGGTLGALHLLADQGISVEYMYACVGQKNGRAIMVMQVNDLQKAETVLAKQGIGACRPEDFFA